MAYEFEYRRQARVQDRSARVKHLRQMLNERGFYVVLRNLVDGGDTLGRDTQLRFLQMIEREFMSAKRAHAHRFNRRAWSRDPRSGDPEREAQRKCAHKLIDIGYKVLAKELHPDKGGSPAVMARLNLLRDKLKHTF
jgi:hypothetical protein